jgi:cystathionine gamma-synthase
MTEHACARRPETKIASAAVGADKAYGAVAPQLCLSANFAFADPAQKPAFDYSRSGNPTRASLEAALADLEGAARGVVTATGMAAVDLSLFTVNAGDLVVAPHDCYGGTHRLLSARARRGHFRVSFIDQTDDAAFAAALDDKPALVLFETPSNPLLRVIDIEARSSAARAAGAVTVADNTFLSPVLQNPLALGCDLVVHSTTKFINGHSDVVGGAVLAKDAALGAELAWWANCTGVTGAPFDSYLTLRGLRTIFTRIERQQETAQALISVLADDERIARINYPGLIDHPGHAIAARQQKGFGSMFSVEFAPEVDAAAFVRALSVFTCAESLGGFESLVCLPALMTHASMPAQARAVAGISDRLVRFSVGLEHERDLTVDIAAALDIASGRLARLKRAGPQCA